MDFNLVSNIESCYVTIPQLSYYSHIPTAIIALLLGFFVFFKNKNGNSLTSKILLFTALTFSVWSVLDLSLWVSIDSRKIMFSWSIINLFEMLASSSTLYFSYVFLEKKDARLIYKLIFGLPLLVFMLFIPTMLNLTGFDIPNCEAEQGKLIYYFYFLEIFFFLWLLTYLIRKIIVASKEDRKMTIYFAIGAICFLASFSGANVVASLTEKWQILQYGLFGMPVFMAFLVYLMIRYKAFNIKLFRAQALVVSMFVLIASQFAFIQNPTNRILTAITLALVSVFGWWLVKSVKKENEQSEELEIANVELRKIDQAKSDFMNIASHQLRTPITVIKGTIDLLRKGDMENFDIEERQHFFESAWTKCRKLEDIVNDILNASALSNSKFIVSDKESGTINLNEMLDRIVKDFDVEVKERGIDIAFSPFEKEKPEIRGVANYLGEVFDNLINNAIKYTPSKNKNYEIRSVRENGSAKIDVAIEKEGNNFIVSVKDNGIGISKEEIPKLFKKFARAGNAVNMYTDGSGLGLYVVKEVVEGHGGKVWVKSELEKGSTFFVSLPIEPDKEVDVKGYFLREKTSNQN